MGCSSEVEGHPPGLEAHQEHPDIRVVCELLNHAVPVIHSHAALQPYTLHSSLYNSMLAERLLLFVSGVHQGGGLGGTRLRPREGGPEGRSEAGWGGG